MYPSLRLTLSSAPPACRLPAVSAAGTPGDDDRQGNTVNSNESGPIEEEDFDPWRDDHEHRVLSQGMRT